ncbi:MAG TPA: leucine-rich repeat domain-containing protein, partial [Corynebacteriales bacterium]|nr:leucine-rich repeat domain-containing protein [Mycobacteriales bacterium]
RNYLGEFQDLIVHNTNPTAHSNEFSKKVDKITEAQRDSLGFMEDEDRIVSGVDGNLNEMPIKASPFKEENTIVMRDGDGDFQDLAVHNASSVAHQDIRNMIAALQGGIIPRGLLQYTANDIRYDKTLLDTYIQNNYSREAQLGDMVRDLDNIEWYYNGEFWDELGPYSLIPLASLYNDGLMSSIDYQILSQLEADTAFYSNTHGIPVKIKFKKFQLAAGQTMDDALPTLPVIDYEAEGGYIPIIRYTFYDSDGNIVGESIGNKPITTGSGGEVDLNEMSYFDYAGRIYGDKYSLLKSAWEHSLTVDPLEISQNSSYDSPRGTAQYPNGETEGVIIPQGVTSIGSFAFFNWSSNTHPLVIPNSVISIGNYSFYDWSANNQPLVIPDSVISIGGNAFQNWSSNNQPLVIPDSVANIGRQAFFGWSSNNQPLVIPNSVTSIGTGAFYGWSLVPYVEMRATTPPTLVNINAFGNQNDAPIYVPDESVEAYKTATNWVDLADRIFPISDKLVGVDLN